MSNVEKHKYTNRLIDETSPYLLQHAHNPVDWYPWGEEAFQAARANDKPILLSIGYSACHWCHVMENESFENEETALLMNNNFVNIKVDREERPDLDAIYMEAVQAMSGSGGGWPLNVFLNADRVPFYGGTYFPPQDRHGLPGFQRVLDTVANAYKNRRSEVKDTADKLAAYLQRSTDATSETVPASENTLINSYVSLNRSFDWPSGGFGTAPKFPQPMVLEYLLRHWRRSGNAEALHMMEAGLAKMAGGGIFDQIGGGFHRYSVDNKWLVPHFEKMLYDNALLSRLYIHACQATRNDLYGRIACETLDYVVREMKDEGGGFYSTQDADSDGVEGKYYVWTPNEITETLGEDDSDLFCKYFGVTTQGNFEGTTILSKVMDEQKLACDQGIDTAELAQRIKRSKLLLLDVRSHRVVPHRDEKILASWNGLMLASFAEAAMAFGRDDYLDVAMMSAKFLTEVMYGGGRLCHSYKDGRGSDQSFLQDYAFVCDGLIRLYQASFDDVWLKWAITLAGEMVSRFWDKNSRSFYDTGEGQPDLLVRPRNMYDNALPSGSSAAATVLLYMARLLDKPDYEQMAASAIAQILPTVAQYALGYGNWLCAIDFYLANPAELVLVGPPQDARTSSFAGIISQRYLPNVVQARVDPQNAKVDIGLLKDRAMMDDLATVYICEKYTCKAPVIDGAELKMRLDELI
ncbi:thioredoxin domain-containing protein [Chloroflexota bacterium]